jgi:putative ABC transport system permease protein
MMKHLLTLIWNRRKANILITLEIFACFLVLFATVAMAVYYADNYRQPLGFDYENVWSVATSISTIADLERQDKETMKKYTSAFFYALRDMPEIEAVANVAQAPYTVSWNRTSVEYGGLRVNVTQNHGSDDLPRVLNMTVVRGRWFSPLDDGIAWDPAIINQKLARELFGGEDPLGKDISDKRPAREGTQRKELRVVGVVSDFRKDGEFSAPETYIFRRTIPGEGRSWEFLVRVRPGTPPAFEQTLVRRLHAINPDWTFAIDPLGELRQSALQMRIAPIAAAAIVVCFLMIMVALGLVGVVWQSVSQRTTEIGLRRALGAATTRIYHQILGELLVVTSVGLLFGVLVVVQFPLLDLVGFLSPTVYIYALVVSVSIVYGLTLLCGLYPSRMATRVQPVEALRWE